MLERIAKMRPFLILAGVSTTVTVLWFALRLPYDDGGWGTFLFIALYTIGTVQVLASGGLHAVNGDWLPWHDVLALALALAFYLAADQLLLRFGNRHRSGSRSGSPEREMNEQ